jgi:hypothetical protein
VTSKLTQSQTPSPPITSPTTIIIFGWVDGRLHPLGKFIEGYKRLHPGTRIIVVLSTSTAIFLLSLRASEEAMRPVVAALSRPAGTKWCGPDDGDEKVLIHVLSNGGDVNLHAACLTYISTFLRPMPHTLFILDSAPSCGSFSTELFRWSRAASEGIIAALPSFSKVPGWRALVLSVAVAWSTIVVGIPELFGTENAVNIASRGLNDRGLLDLEAPRVYIYSEQIK